MIFVTAMGALRSYESLKDICLKVSLKRPQRMTSVALRKYTATLSQVGRCIDVVYICGSG